MKNYIEELNIEIINSFILYSSNNTKKVVVMLVANSNTFFRACLYTKKLIIEISCF